MMKKIWFLITLGILLNISLYSYAKEIPFTQEDRDRLIRLEEGQKALNQRINGVEKSFNQRIDDLKEEIRDMKTFMLWGYGILFGGMGILIGFVIWDRRTALAPAIKQYKELEEREEKIEKVLKELSTRDPNVKEALRHVGLL